MQSYLSGVQLYFYILPCTIAHPMFKFCTANEHICTPKEDYCTPNATLAQHYVRVSGLHTQCLVCTPNVWFAKFAHPMFQSILTRISLGELTADLARMCSRIANSSCLFFSKTWRRETTEMDQAILTEHCL